MRVEQIVSTCKETFIDGGPKQISATVHSWANGEGASLMVHGPGEGIPIRMAGAFRWEEWAIIQVALAAIQVGG